MEKPWKKVFRGLVNSNPMLYRINRIMYDRTALIIDRMKNVRAAGVHKWIAKSLGISLIQFNRALKRFQKNSFSFTIDTAHHKIGLVEYAIYVKDKYVEYQELHPTIRSWLRSYAKTFIPRGTLIIIAVPFNRRGEMFRKIDGWLNELNANTISIHLLTRRLQPSFTKCEPVNHPLFKGYTLEELEGAFTNASEDRPDWFITEDKMLSIVSEPSDIVDLILLKELEKDAFANMNLISRKHRIKPGRLRKHLAEHVVKREVINGIYLKATVFVEAFGSPLLLLMKVSDRSLYYKWINFFDKLDNTLGVGYSPYSSENVLYVALSRTFRYSEHLKDFLVSMAHRGLIEELIPLEYVVGSTIKYTLPYKNFSQDTRSWSLELDVVHERVERRVLRKKD